MNGRARFLAQISAGVRGLVEELDFLRIKCGTDFVNVLTPKVETRLRCGFPAVIPLRVLVKLPIGLEFVIQYKMGFPKASDLEIEEMRVMDSCANIELLNESVVAEIIDAWKKTSRIKSDESDVYPGAFELLRLIHAITNIEAAAIHCASETHSYDDKNDDDCDDEPVEYKCGRCRYILFRHRDLSTTHSKNLQSQIKSSSGEVSYCTSMFLEDPPEWLDITSGVTGGKVSCPNCSAKLGHWDWSGLQCGCGGWVTPGFQVVRLRVDPTRPLSEPVCAPRAAARGTTGVTDILDSSNPTLHGDVTLPGHINISQPLTSIQAPMRERGSSGNHGSDQVKAASEDGKIGLKLAPFNPTGADAIAAAVDLLSLTGGDKLLDLGCGDGRLLVEAKRRFPSITVIGIEYDYTLCQRARLNIETAFPGALAGKDVQLIHGDAFTADLLLLEPTALFAYLVPTGLEQLRPAIVAALLRGVRLVTYMFSMRNLIPDRTVMCKGSTLLRLYTRHSITNTEEDTECTS